MRFLLFIAVCSSGLAAASSVTGEVSDPQGKPAAGATVRLTAIGRSDQHSATSGPDGRFAVADVPSGEYRIAASAPGFASIAQSITVADAQDLTVNLRFDRLAGHADSVTVTADVTQQSVQQPDPAQRVMVREEILDANPGRPGAPVSIPGLPIETASGGIKAPQYFAPGVAGDHGEPVA